MPVLSSLLLGVVSGVYGRVLGVVVGPLSVAFVLHSHRSVEGVVHPSVLNEFSFARMTLLIPILCPSRSPGDKRSSNLFATLGSPDSVAVGQGRICRPPARVTPKPQFSSSDSHHEAPIHI